MSARRFMKVIGAICVIVLVGAVTYPFWALKIRWLRPDLARLAAQEERIAQICSDPSQVNAVFLGGWPLAPFESHFSRWYRDRTAVEEFCHAFARMGPPNFNRENASIKASSNSDIAFLGDNGSWKLPVRGGLYHDYGPEVSWVLHKYVILSGPEGNLFNQERSVERTLKRLSPHNTSLLRLIDDKDQELRFWDVSDGKRIAELTAEIAKSNALMIASRVRTGGREVRLLQIFPVDKTQPVMLVPVYSSPYGEWSPGFDVLWKRITKETPTPYPGSAEAPSKPQSGQMGS